MSRVLTFSRKFPSYHPRKGESTYFVEKIWESIGMPTSGSWKECELVDECLRFIRGHDEIDNKPKHHTIRAGNRFKVGDWFSPRVWSGKPYNSKQIIIAPDIQVKKVWGIGLRIRRDFKEFYCNDCDLTGTSISRIAANDGLTIEDLFSWFNKPFEGQIICWNESIEY